MPRKGQFKKGGGRVGGSSRSRTRRTTTAIVVAAPRAPARRYSPRPKRKARAHRRRRGGGGINLLHLGLAAAGLAFVTGAKSPVPSVRNTAQKIPGAKTFGTAAAVGVGALAVDRFVKPNKWLKLLGCAGIVLAAAKAGESGTDFKWVGDDDVMADLDDDDVSGDDDIADGDDDIE